MSFTGIIGHVVPYSMPVDSSIVGKRNHPHLELQKTQSGLVLFNISTSFNAIMEANRRKIGGQLVLYPRKWEVRECFGITS